MRIYIAGPITGQKDFMERFAAAENKLRAAGHETSKPEKLNLMVLGTYKQKEYMKIRIPLLDTCEAVFCLIGWNHSDVANQEVAHAMETRKTILFEQVA